MRAASLVVGVLLSHLAEASFGMHLARLTISSVLQRSHLMWRERLARALIALLPLPRSCVLRTLSGCSDRAV